jgi:integrase
MAYYRKRGKAWSYTIDLGHDHSGKRKQQTKGGFRTKKEAQEACAEIVAQLKNDEYIEPTKITFNDFLMSYMTDHVKQHVRESTYEMHMHVIQKHILPFFGKILLQKMTPMHINKFQKAKLEQGYASSYVKQMHAIISKTLRAAYKWEMIPKNIVALVSQPKVHKPQVHKPQVKTWSTNEINQFIEFSNKRRDQTYFLGHMLAIYTGMRKGEILALRWQDCDLDKKIIRVRQTLYKRKGGGYLFNEPKTAGSKRSIAIPETLVSLLLQQKKKQAEHKLLWGQAYQDYDLVMCYTTGKPLDYKDLNRDLKYITEQTGLPKIRFHDFRHTHATLLLELGENPKVISERLGHASITITLDTYSHVTPQHAIRISQPARQQLCNPSKKYTQLKMWSKCGQTNK